MTRVQSIVDQYQAPVDDFVDQWELDFSRLVHGLLVDEHGIVLEEQLKGFPVRLLANLIELHLLHDLLRLHFITVSLNDPTARREIHRASPQCISSLEF